MLTRRSLLPLLGGLTLGLTGPARAEDAVRIGQATSALSFLPIWAARAIDSFPAQGLTLTSATLPGGDPTTLAALDAGDIDLAAVGGDTLLNAVAKGQPFQMVSALMSRVTLQLVVSKAALAKAGIAASDPLPARLAALRGAVVGVSAVGGAQDRAARWLAGQAGLDPKTGVQLAMVGGPPALQAALENGRIDAFVLSPPEGQIAEAGGYGVALVDYGRDYPALATVPFLVLVARTPVTAAGADRIARSVRALQAGSAAVQQDPAKLAGLIQQTFFPRIPPAVIASGVEAMRGGIADGGRFTPEGIAALASFSGITGPSGDGEDTLWTNRYVNATR